MAPRFLWPAALALIALALVDVGHARAAGALVVVANISPRPVEFVVTHPTAEGVAPVKVALEPMETRPLAVGREPEIAFTLEGKETRFRLDPYTAYLFAEVERRTIFQGIELTGTPPKVDDVPKSPVASKPYKVPVKVFVDNSERRLRGVWEKNYGNRVKEVSALLERQTGVGLELLGFEEWKSDPSDDLFGGLREFESKAKVEAGTLAIGFSPFKTLAPGEKPGKPDEVTQYNIGRGPFGTHLLIRDGSLRSEAERQEVLLQELGHWLGAAHTKDPFSVMRLKLGDGQANAVRFRVQFDPINLIAVNIWANHRRAGKLTTWADIPPADRDRLEVIYKTLAQICPEDTVGAEHLAVLERVKNKQPEEAAPGEPRVMKPKVAPGVLAPPAAAIVDRTAKQESVRKVVQAVTARAKVNWQMIPAERLKGDTLTAELVRVAAGAAGALEAGQQAPAFLIALGVALDDSTTLRNNPLTRELCKTVESDEERTARVAALGNPTVRSRRDLCQHFAISAALTELIGAKPAEGVGLAKELLDMQGTSGFSFVDLTADLAGVAFARHIKAEPTAIEALARKFAVEQYMPATVGLREGLSPKRFEADYGSVGDKRFTDAVDAIRARVAECPGYVL